MKKRRRWCVNLLLVLLLLIGVGLVFNNQIKNFIISSTASKYKLDKLERADIETNLELEGNFDFEQVVPINSEDVIRSAFSSSHLPVIGGIAIPAVKINLPIFKGVAYENLFYGAGTTAPNQQMGEGNYGLASHHVTNERLLFSPLSKVSTGDKIYLSDLAEIFVYDVLNIKTVSSDTSANTILDEIVGEKWVTLITCGDAAGSTRLIVQGRLNTVMPIKKATAEIQAAFEIETNV